MVAKRIGSLRRVGRIMEKVLSYFKKEKLMEKGKIDLSYYQLALLYYIPERGTDSHSLTIAINFDERAKLASVHNVETILQSASNLNIVEERKGSFFIRDAWGQELHKLDAPGNYGILAILDLYGRIEEDGFWLIDGFFVSVHETETEEPYSEPIKLGPHPTQGP